MMLHAVPIAINDPWYSTPQNTALTVGTSDTPLLANDWDPEGGSLTATVVDSPSAGTLSAFSGTAGTFVYTPNSSFVGVDTFSYRVSNGTDNSNLATVSIAVGGHLGPRTNLEEAARDGELLTGELELSEPLTPGLSLVYDSSTRPRPIVVLETFLQDGSAVPSSITAQLTFDGTAGTAYSYVTTGLAAGDALRFALQAGATSLATGRYDYSVKLTANMSGTPVDHIYTGSQNVVNRSDSTHPFGRGWQLAGLDELAIASDGVLWVQDDGDALWFAEDGTAFETAAGDASFSTLVMNGDGTYTLTNKHGTESNFSSTGKLTSIVDRNGNTTSYTYSSGLLTKITDPFGRDTTLTYTSGRLTSVTDFASRSATLTYDGSGRMTKITQPDPDGAGSLASPETTFTYDSTTHQLTGRTNPLNFATSYTYGSHDRLTTTANPDSSSKTLTAIQTIGLPTATTGNSLAAAAPAGNLSDERGKNWRFRSDPFGNLVQSIDPNGYSTITERNADGLAAKLIQEDPDSTGPLGVPITVFGYDAIGNLVYRNNADNQSRSWTYTTSFNLVDTETNELSHSLSYAYDTSGNLTQLTDQAGNVSSYAYNSRGLVTSITTADPDGAGSLAAAVTAFAYDSNGRLVTLTNPDSSTRTYTYDSADNLLTETDELSETTTYAWDSLARLVSQTDRESAVTTFGYNAASALIKVTDALAGETDYEYNSRGWMTKEIKPDPDGAGSITRSESTFGYDVTGNQTSVGRWTTMGVPVSHTYDDAGRLTQSEGPLVGAITHYGYDALGNLTTVTDPLDRVTTYRYDILGRVIETEGNDPDGSGPGHGPITQSTYDARGQLTQLTDALGNVTVYEYDQRGLTTGKILPDPDGAGPQPRPAMWFEYDNLGRLISQADPLGRVTSFKHDNRNRLIEQTLPDPDGSGSLASPVTTLGYDSAGRRTSITDPLGRVTSFTFDGEGRMLTLTQPDPDGAGTLAAPVTSSTYDALGNVLSVTDPLGNVTSFEYDGLSRQTKITQADPDGGGPLASPVTLFTFDANVLTKTTDPMGVETTFQYDSIGRRSGVTDEAGNQTTYSYDAVNNLLTVTDPDPDGAGSLAAPVTTFGYDDYNRVVGVTDPESGQTIYTYNAVGNLLSLDDPANNTTAWAYDALGRVTSETNALSKSRTFDYDAAGNLARRTDREGRVIQYSYDRLGRRTTEQWYSAATTPALSVVTNHEGGVTDEVQRVGFTTGMGFIGGTFTLSFGGQTTSAISYNASAATVQSALEGLSSIGSGNVSVTKLHATSTKQEWQIAYAGSLAGTNVAQMTINTSSVTTMMGPPTEIEATDIAGGGSGNEEQTVTLSNATGGSFRLAFEDQVTDPIAYNASAGTVETALESLDTVDNVTVTGAAGGPWTVTFVGTHAGVNVPAIGGNTATVTAGTLSHTIDYEYDAANQVTSVADAFSSYEYGYDALGRVLTVDNFGTSGVANVILTSAYDAANNRTSLAATIAGVDDFLSSSTYNALNQLTRLDQTGQSGGNSVAEKRIDFAYNAIGQFTSIARYKDTTGGSTHEIATSTYSYDLLNRLTGLVYKEGATNLFTPYSWSFDNLSRITQQVSEDGTSDYAYDSTSQLTTADHDYQTDETYSYDANGNRTMTGYSTGTNNRLLNDGTHTDTYDFEGNRTKKTVTATGEATEYEWDHRNRLVRVTHLDSIGDPIQTLDYAYDVLDRRIEKSDTPAVGPAYTERYVYDGEHLALKFGGSALANRYLHGPVIDQILADEQVSSLSSPGDVLWPLVDNLGTVRDLAEYDSGTGDTVIVNHISYDAYGGSRSETNAAVDHLFGYTGREWDAEADLQHNRARWYDPAVGRWLSEDPIGFQAGDVNLSRYVGNEPIGKVDPKGLLSSDYTETAQGQQDYAQWFESDSIAWSPPPENWDPTRRTWGEHLYNGLYGYSDVATVGMAPLVRYMIGYDAGIDRTDPSYFIGAAIPIAIATGGSVVLPAGGFSYVLPWVSAGQASYTTIWTTRATVGVSASVIAAMEAEIAALSAATIRTTTPHYVRTQLPRIAYGEGSNAPQNATQLVQQYISTLTREFLRRLYP
jgi:RHS repeat-associated protein